MLKVKPEKMQIKVIKQLKLVSHFKLFFRCYTLDIYRKAYNKIMDLNRPNTLQGKSKSFLLKIFTPNDKKTFIDGAEIE